MSKVVAFHSYQLGERGTEIHMYKYAKYNREILGNESLIISTSARPTPSFEMFNKEFKTILCPYDLGGDNSHMRQAHEKICSENNVTHFWSIKQGSNDGVLPTNVDTCVSAVGGPGISPHGSVFTLLCKYLVDKYKMDFPCLYPIVERDDSDNVSNFREEFGIPKEAIVLGRHGGKDTFNLNFVKKAIIDVLNIRNDIYFVFLNTDVFYKHKNIFYIDYTSDFSLKSKFVNTCDAMIHAREDGEIFSLSLAEFSIRNKPIITWKPNFNFPPYDFGHFYVFGDQAIYYSDDKDISNILINISKKDIESKDWDVYKDRYSPSRVMSEFDNLFLSRKI